MLHIKPHAPQKDEKKMPMTPTRFVHKSLAFDHRNSWLLNSDRQFLRRVWLYSMSQLTKVSFLKQLTFSIQSSEVIGKWFSVCFPACVSDKNKTSNCSESIFRFFFDGGSNNPFSCTRFCWDELFNFLKIDFLKSSENGTKGSNQCDIISLVIACKSKTRYK